MSETRRQKALWSLAAQLYYVRHTTEIGGAKPYEVPGVSIKPPMRWSSTKSVGAFKTLPEHVQLEWMAYAERIAPFCYIGLNWR